MCIFPHSQASCSHHKPHMFNVNPTQPTNTRPKKLCLNWQFQSPRRNGKLHGQRKTSTSQSTTTQLPMSSGHAHLSQISCTRTSSMLLPRIADTCINIIQKGSKITSPLFHSAGSSMIISSSPLTPNHAIQ